MKHKVGLVGCGHISASHLRGWAKTSNCEVVGVLDLNRELAESRAREFGISKIYDDLNELIEEVEVVDVCTPPQSHSVIALEVARAGKHLVIEKPLVTAVEEWDQIRAAVQAASSSITVIHNLKYSRGVQQAKAWVDDGRIGRLIGFTREFLTHPDSDRMLGGKPHWSHSLPGGRWFETLPHELYLAHYFIGNMELGAVTAVRSDHAPAGAPADEVLIALRSDDCIGTIRFSGNARINKRLLTLHGTEGEIYVDVLSDAAVLNPLGDSKWKRAAGLPYLRAAGALAQGVQERAGYLYGRLKGMDPHARIIEAFARYIDGAGPEPTPMEEIDFVIRSGALIGTAIEADIAATTG